jgi:hypothetical protein
MRKQAVNSSETSCERLSGKEEKLGIIKTLGIKNKLNVILEISCHLNKYVSVPCLRPSFKCHQICHTVQCHIA